MKYRSPSPAITRRSRLGFEGPSESSHPIGRSSKPNGSVLRRTERLKNRYTLGGAILIPWVAVRCSAISRHVCLARLIRRISSRYGRRMLRNGRGRDESPFIYGIIARLTRIASTDWTYLHLFALITRVLAVLIAIDKRT